MCDSLFFACIHAWVADRRPQFARPCHMDPLGVWTFFTAGRLIRTAPTHKAAGREIFIAWLQL